MSDTTCTPIVELDKDTTTDYSSTSFEENMERAELLRDCPVNRCERRHGKLYNEKEFKHGHKNARRGGNSKYIY